jgi:Ca2+/Na+ antiporter
MELLILAGLATAFNLLVILWKLKNKRYSDGLLDFMLFITIIFLFSGTLGGMVIGMIASFVISIYLYFTYDKKQEEADRIEQFWNEFMKDLDEISSRR